MLHEIFSSVFQTGSSAFELGPFLACTAVSLLLGLLIAWTHAHGSACSRSFLLTLVMLPAVVQTVIMLVNGSRKENIGRWLFRKSGWRMGC